LLLACKPDLLRRRRRWGR